MNLKNCLQDFQNCRPEIIKKILADWLRRESPQPERIWNFLLTTPKQNIFSLLFI